MPRNDKQPESQETAEFLLHTGTQGQDLRTRVINHIKTMHQKDQKYAEFALSRYATRMPWLDLPEWSYFK